MVNHLAVDIFFTALGLIMLIAGTTMIVGLSDSRSRSEGFWGKIVVAAIMAVFGWKIFDIFSTKAVELLFP